MIGETVYDPACGSAGFLCEAFLYMKEKIKSVSDHVTLQKNTFYGKIATSAPNIATSAPNIATDHLAENKRIIDGIVKPKVKLRMTKEQIQECIIEACIVEHSIDDLAELLNKSTGYLRNFILPELVADGILLRTKPSHSPKQTYMTNPKYKKA